MRLDSARQQATAAGLAILGIAVSIVVFPPSRHAFYPRCPVYQWSGFLCPGCGVTRALEALLAGQWAAAARQNLLVVALAPAIAALVMLEGYAALRWNRWSPIAISPRAVPWLLALVALFGVARNFEPLLLSPR